MHDTDTHPSLHGTPRRFSCVPLASLDSVSGEWAHHKYLECARVRVYTHTHTNTYAFNAPPAAFLTH